jgi:hypothetical protein
MYNDTRLNSGIDYITPKDMFTGHAERDQQIGSGEGTPEESPASCLTDGNGLVPVVRKSGQLSFNSLS